MDEQIHRNIVRTWREDDGVAIYRLNGVTVDVLARWDQHIIEMLNAWPDDQPCKLIYDLSKSGVSLPFLVFSGFRVDSPVVNTNAKGQVERMLAARPDLRIALALVITSNVSGRIVLGRVGDNFSVTRIAINTFFSQEAALEWLRGF
jgi:hypothetical protein